MQYNAIDIAHWFINRNLIDVKNQEDEKMTLMKLLKLLYYAEGSSLALNNKSLFPEKIVAWEHGPVVAEVYKKFPDAYNLSCPEKEIKDSLNKITETDKELLEDVYSVFGKYSASGLRNKTHSEAPWKDATDDGMHLKMEISREAIKDYFKKHYVEEA